MSLWSCPKTSHDLGETEPTRVAQLMDRIWGSDRSRSVHNTTQWLPWEADGQESSHQGDWNAEETVTFPSGVLMFRFLSNCTVVPTQRAELIIYYESFSNPPAGLANRTFPSPQLRLEGHNSTLSSNLPSFHRKKKNTKKNKTKNPTFY